MRREDVDSARRRRETTGRMAEFAAAAALMAKGYRILARRVRTPQGEIDLIAVRGRRIAFIEVKQRASLAEAEDSLRPTQVARIQRSAEHWIARNRFYRDYDIGLDAILVVPWTWPAHRPDALQDGPMDWRLRPKRTRW